MDGDGEDGDEHIDCNEKCEEACEESQNQADATEELRYSRDVAEPSRHAEAADVVRIVLEAGEGLAPAGGVDLIPAVIEHGEAEGEAEQQNAPGLKTIEPSRHDAGLLLSRFYGTDGREIVSVMSLAGHIGRGSGGGRLRERHQHGLAAA